VRYFPRASRGRMAAVLAVSACALASMVPFASANDDDLKHKQKQVHHAVTIASLDLDESSAALRAVEAKLATAKTQLVAAQGALTAARARVTAAKLKDQELQTQLETARQELATARTDLAAGRMAVAEQRQHVVNTITDYYEQGDPELLGMASILDSENPTDITRKLEYMDTVVGQEDQAYDDLRASEVLLQVRETQEETAEAAVAQRRAEAAAHLLEVQRLETKAETAAAAVARSVIAQRAAATKALEVRRHDAAVLRSLKARENRIKQQLIQQAQQEQQHNGGYHGETDGVLNMPVDGPVTSPYGWRIHPIYGYWGLHNGTDFGAGCGQPLWAVAGGTVLTEYYDSVWGNRLYLNLGNFNGKNVTVIYNHMSGYRVSTGEHVDRGETVGYVGTTGWSTGCHLHFTVMVNGETVDPMTMIGS